MPRKWCAIDAEGSRDNLLGVAFWSDTTQAYVTHHDQIRDYLSDHANRGYTFVAHNASYDLPVIFWTLDIPMKAIYYDDHFNRGRWRYHPKKPYAELWDSLNLSGGLSIADLGKAIGLEKYPTPQVLQGKDPNKYDWQCEKHGAWECIECYALRDAEIVYRYLESFAEVLRQWDVSPSARIAGVSQSVWRALDRPDPVQLSDGRIRYLSRLAYFGGRVECFKLGHLSPLYTADVQSMYPSVMYEGRFPDPQSMVYLEGIRWEDIPPECEGVCEATVVVPASALPPLPNSHKGLRVFATGLQRGYWILAELRYAVTQGCQIHKVHRAAWGTKSLTPFTMFIGVLWEMRLEYKRTGDPRSQTIKALMNNAYGRLGLHGRAEQEIIEPWDPELTMADYVRRAARLQGKPKPLTRRGIPSDLGVYPELIDGKPYVRFGSPAPFEQKWTNVLWAATITALARVKLHRYLMMQGPNLAYCDTDSVFATHPIVGLGEGLGALADHTAYTSGWVVGPKLYSLEQIDGTLTTKAKGVPRDKALAFLRGEEVVFDSPISPRAQSHQKGKAGVWIPIHRERRLVPARRVALNPELLGQNAGWSETVPLQIGPG